MNKDLVSDRMKRYESAYSIYLPTKLPLMIRVDGRAFSSLTNRLFNKSYSENFNNVLCRVTLGMMAEIPNSVLAYQQSDEISFLIVDYKKEETQPWFNNRLDKIISNSAALCSVMFNQEMRNEFGEEFTSKTCEIFDARAFVLPQQEVFNYFNWRQADCRRNALNSFAREHLGHSQIQNKSPKLLIEQLSNNGINFYEQPLSRILGTIYSLEQFNINGVMRNKPISLGSIIIPENKELIDKHVNVKII